MTSVELGQVIKPRNVRRPPGHSVQPFIGLEHVSSYSGELISHGSTAGLRSATATFFKGDVLYGRLRPYLNKVIVASFDGAASAEFIVFPGDSDKISAEFLRHRLRCRDFLDFTSMLDRGDRPRVKWEQISKFRFDLPNYVDQVEIAKYLTAIFEQARYGEFHVNRILHLAKNYKRALLRSAFDGQLTNSDVGLWNHARAADVCKKVQSGGTPRTGFTEEPGVPFLKVYNIVNQRVDFAYKPQYVPADVHKSALRKSIAFPGDVIMNIVGPPLGKVAIIPPGEYAEWNLNQALTLFRPSKSVSSKWLYYFLCSGESIDAIAGATRGQTGQVNISLTQCRNFSIPIPPRSEQDAIIDSIESAFSSVETIVSNSIRVQRLLAMFKETAALHALAFDEVSIAATND